MEGLEPILAPVPNLFSLDITLEYELFLMQPFIGESD